MSLPLNVARVIERIQFIVFRLNTELKQCFVINLYSNSREVRSEGKMLDASVYRIHFSSVKARYQKIYLN